MEITKTIRWEGEPEHELPPPTRLIEWEKKEPVAPAAPAEPEAAAAPKRRGRAKGE